jgi:hypothetical protein
MWTCRQPTQAPRRRLYHGDKDDAFLSGFVPAQLVAEEARGNAGLRFIKMLVLAPKYFPSLTDGQGVRLYRPCPSGSLPVGPWDAPDCPAPRRPTHQATLGRSDLLPRPLAN